MTSWFRRFAPAAACWLAATASPALTISNIVDEITPSSYSNFHIGLFVHTNNNRGFIVSGPQYIPANQHDPARDVVLAAFTNLGLTASLDPFAAGSYTNCNNVIGIKPGLNPSNYGYYIIGAHYDSVNATPMTETNRPGADDNASGVAGVLEVARVLSAYTFKATLIFIAFDNEEAGLKGSAHYVADSTASTNGDPAKIYRGDIHSMISMDMIGFNPAGATYNQAHIYGASSIPSMPVRTNMVNALAQFGGLTPQNSGGANNSDHGPFYYNGTYGDGGTGRIDSCLLIEQNWPSNPNYHQAGDAVDTPNYIDYEFAAKMTRAVAGYLCTQAGLVPPATLAAAPEPTADGMVLSWDSMAGLVQQVEYSDDLMNPDSWAVLGTYTNLDGAAALSVTNSIDGVARRYYRVQSW